MGRVGGGLDRPVRGGPGGAPRSGPACTPLSRRARRADRRARGLLREGSPEPSSQDAELIRSFAQQAGVALERARTYEVEHEAAVTLQRNLMPEHLAPEPRVEVVSRYLPGNARRPRRRRLVRPRRPPRRRRGARRRRHRRPACRQRPRWGRCERAWRPSHCRPAIPRRSSGRSTASRRASRGRSSRRSSRCCSIPRRTSFGMPRRTPASAGDRRRSNVASARGWPVGPTRADVRPAEAAGARGPRRARCSSCTPTG